MGRKDGWRLQFIGECLLLVGCVGWLSERMVAALPKVPGTIEQVDIRGESASGRAWVWVPSVTYEYSVDGKRYEGHRFSWRPLSERADEFSAPSPKLSGPLAAYSQGSPAGVYYDPRYPERSFLHLNPTGRYSWLARFGALLFLAGFLIVKRQSRSIGLKS